MGIVPARCIAAYPKTVLIPGTAPLYDRSICAGTIYGFSMAIPLVIGQNLIRDFFGPRMAGVAACAVFALFVLLVFALSIQFSSYFARGRP